MATPCLAASIPTGATLTLRNTLGRQLWHQPVAAGNTELRLPVVGRPTGLYLVQLDLPGQLPLT